MDTEVFFFVFFRVEWEGSHGEQRRVVTGICPAFESQERGLLVSTAEDSGMPLQPIGSIVPRCAEGVIMEVEGERGDCSAQGAGDTETLLWGH